MKRPPVAYHPDALDLSRYRYDLPPDRIAQSPVEPRDLSRLLVVNRHNGTFTDAVFRDLEDHLSPGDCLVLNNTRVTARRLKGRRSTGARVEALLLRQIDELTWEVLARPGRRLLPGARIEFPETPPAHVIAVGPHGLRHIRFDAPLAEDISGVGEIPLPPYIHKHLDQEERYQTVYAVQAGSAAAPTAGLHFTPRLLHSLEQAGVTIVYITLDVGIATFLPPDPDKLNQGILHTERACVSADAARRINAASGRIIAVGTTVVRTLESAASGPRQVDPFDGETDILIAPGFEFRAVDALITNLHVPASTPMMLTAAWCGLDLLLQAYAHALQHDYRFFSFGDAMLII